MLSATDKLPGSNCPPRLTCLAKENAYTKYVRYSLRELIACHAVCLFAQILPKVFARSQR
jgi:hypothetical protein